MIDRLAADAEAVIANAHEAAKSIGRDGLDSAGLLLGMLVTEFSPAAKTLAAQGVSAAAVRDLIAARWPLPERPVMTGVLPLTDEIITILTDAQKLAHYSGSETLGSGHLLLALVRLRESVGAQLLWSCVADLGALEAAVEAKFGNAP